MNKAHSERIAAGHFWINKCKTWIWILLRTVLLGSISFVILYPIFTKISIAFKQQIDIYDSTVVWVPKHLTMENFKLVFQSLNYFEVLLNTVLLSGAVMLLQTFSCLLAGYGFSRIRFRGSGLLFACVIFTIVVPPQTIIVPMYLQYKNFDVLGLVSMMIGNPINLINTYWPFIISSALGMGLRTGLFVFIFRQFFRGLPKEMEEAAFVDGAGTFTTFIRVVMPNAVPSMISVMLFSFVWQWNDSYFTSLILTDPKIMSTMMASAGSQISYYLGLSGSTQTDPLYLSMIQNAAVLLAIVPLIILYFFVQRHFVESMERSGVVG
jgi:multiple sugar transport system permease protein